MKPVAKALAALGVTPAVIWTGQHRALDPSHFGLDGYPSFKLGCPGMEDPHQHVAAVARALRPLLRSAPDLLIVQGDTSSALGGALA